MADTPILTADQINALTGPDLVRAVCVHVLGWRERNTGAASLFPVFEMLRGDVANVGFKDRISKIFNPLADWNDAMEVAANIEKRGYHLRLQSPWNMPTESNPGPFWWHCGFTPHGETGWNDRPDHRATGESGQEALLRAALMVAIAEKETK